MRGSGLPCPWSTSPMGGSVRWGRSVRPVFEAAVRVWRSEAHPCASRGSSESHPCVPGRHVEKRSPRSPFHPCIGMGRSSHALAVSERGRLRMIRLRAEGPTSAAGRHDRGSYPPCRSVRLVFKAIGPKKGSRWVGLESSRLRSSGEHSGRLARIFRVDPSGTGESTAPRRSMDEPGGLSHGHTCQMEG